MVIAIGALRNGEDGRSLDALCHGKAAEEVPPAFQILDEGFRRREDLVHEAFLAADVGFQRVVQIPAQVFFRRVLVPAFDEGTEQVIVVRIDDGVPARAHGLGGRKFRTRLDLENRIGDDFAVVDFFVEVAPQGVDLMFPEVADEGKDAGDVAVECGIAHGRFRFIGIARERAAPDRRKAGDDARTPVARLDVFQVEGRHFDVMVLSRREIVDRSRVELLYRGIHDFLDGQDRIIGAQGFCHRAGQAPGKIRIVFARDIEQQHILRPQQMDVESCRHGGVDAAGEADRHLMDAELLQKFRCPVADGVVDLFDLAGKAVRLTIRFDLSRIRVVAERQQRFLKARRIGEAAPVAVIDAAAAVEGKDVLAVILDAHAVAVEQGQAAVPCLGRKNIVALAVLLQRKGRTGDVAQDVGPVLAEHLRDIVEIILRPAVFADEDAELYGFAAHRHGDRFNEVRDRRAMAQLRHEFRQAVEIAVIVELPVVRKRGLADVRIGQAAPQQLAVLGDEAGIVAAQPAVLVHLVPVETDIAEDDTDAVRGGNDFFPVGFTVFQIGALLPQIAQKISGNHHFRQQQDVHAGFFCFPDKGPGVTGIGLRVSGNDPGLSKCKFQLQLIVTPVPGICMTETVFIKMLYKTILYQMGAGYERFVPVLLHAKGPCHYGWSLSGCAFSACCGFFPAGCNPPAWTAACESQFGVL